MHRNWQGLGTAGERLQWAREAAGYENAADAADALGMSGSKASTYFGHENGSRGLARSGARYAEFFRVSFDWLMRGKGQPRAGLIKSSASSGRSDPTAEIKIIGRVGAGPEGSISFEEQSDLGTAPAVPGWTDTTVAVEVWGNSMRPIAYDGWLVYYDKREGALTPDMLGQPCVIGLASGHTVMKVPQHGSRRGVYNLESANPAVDTMRDQRVKWAAFVTAIVPRRAARKLRADTKGVASV
jgi:hypothetical protein